uniref:Uncharacterized protein n=1 Tax=Anopheles melas TaxID=34690 RepID=A0A182UIW2_9DIPT
MEDTCATDGGWPVPTAGGDAASQVDADEPLVEEEMEDGALGELLLSLPLPPVAGLSGDSSGESPAAAAAARMLPALSVPTTAASFMSFLLLSVQWGVASSFATMF